MIRTLAKFSIACVIAISMAGCAVEARETNSPESEEDLIAQSHAALSGASTPVGAVQLYARATHDSNLGTMVDVATTPLAPIGTPPSVDPHNGDQFVTIMVYVDAPGKKRDVLRVIGRSQIGPGGGCIHFNIVATPGTVLYIGGVVKLDGQPAASIGIAAPVTVSNGDWDNDPTVSLHPG
jgi:hypothetical protein